MILIEITNCALGQYSFTDVWEQSVSTAGWSNLCTSTCTGNNIIIGGPNCYGSGSSSQKVYTIAKTHYQVRIEFQAWWTDNWPSGQNLILNVDGTNRYSKGKPGYMANYCGSSFEIPYQDYFANVILDPFSHTSGSLTLHFTSTLSTPSSEASWGFKNIKITVWPNCATGCSACYGNLISECTSCSAGWYLSGNTCIQCWQGSGPTLYSCATCSGAAYTNCKSCNAPAFLYPDPEGECRTPCPDGFWGDTSTRKCKACHNSASSPFTCKTCTAGSSSSCTSCNDGTFLYGGQCLASCPNGYWEDTSINECMPCWSGSGPTFFTCATCSGGAYTNCKSCNAPAFLYPDSEGECRTPCPDGFWGDTSSRTCKPCWSSASSPFTCKTCTTGSSSSCTSCNVGSFLYGGECLVSCPDGYWADESTQICQPCYNNPDGSATQQACATCSGPEGTNCLTCFAGTYYFSVDMSCLSTCPPGYYADDSPYPDNLCRQCYQNDPSISLDGTCATCSGPDSNQCLTCNGSWYLDSTTGKCVDSCPAGYIAVSSTPNICQRCYQHNPTISLDGTCATCSGPDSNQCLTCADFWYLDSTTGRCVNVCPDGYFGASSNNTCQQCYQAPSPSSAYQSCDKCIGETNKDCTSCSSGAFLFQEDQACLSICPDRYWGDTTTNTCQPCYSNSTGPNYSCATCVAGGKDNCSSCNSGYFLYSTNAGGECLSQCPEGLWGNTSTNQCQRLPCSEGSFLQPESNKSCLATCPSSYWRDSSSNQCITCNVTCQSNKSFFIDKLIIIFFLIYDSH